MKKICAGLKAGNKEELEVFMWQDQGYADDNV